MKKLGSIGQGRGWFRNNPTNPHVPKGGGLTGISRAREFARGVGRTVLGTAMKNVKSEGGALSYLSDASTAIPELKKYPIGSQVLMLKVVDSMIQLDGIPGNVSSNLPSVIKTAIAGVEHNYKGDIDGGELKKIVGAGKFEIPKRQKPPFYERLNRDLMKLPNMDRATLLGEDAGLVALKISEGWGKTGGAFSTQGDLAHAYYNLLFSKVRKSVISEKNMHRRETGGNPISPKTMSKDDADSINRESADRAMKAMKLVFENVSTKPSVKRYVLKKDIAKTTRISDKAYELSRKSLYAEKKATGLATLTPAIKQIKSQGLSPRKPTAKRRKK